MSHQHDTTHSTGSLFRSEDMLYIRLLISDDVQYDTVKQLGNYGKFHIIDLSHLNAENNERLSTYKKRVQNCVYYEKKLQSFYTAFQEYNITVPSIDIKPIELQTNNSDVLEYVKQYIEPLETKFIQNVLFKKQQLNNISTLLAKLNILKFLQSQHIDNTDIAVESQYGSLEDNTEKQRLINKVSKNDTYDQLRPMRDELMRRKQRTDLESQPTSYQTTEHLTTTITGVISVDKQQLFQRMLFRLSRGNAVVNTTDIAEPLYDATTQAYLKKVVFVIVTMGTHLVARIHKLCTHLGADIHTIDNAVPYNKQITDINNKLTELYSVIEETDTEITALLQSFALDQDTQTSDWLNLLHAIRVEIGICDVLRQCTTESTSSRMLICEGFIPVNEINELRNALHEAVKYTKLRQAVLQLLPTSTKHVIPTYLKTNKFTGSFQSIVDTYGTPRYKEINPGLFTIITFPFLFGVMYGDIGHGFIIFLTALMMVVFESRLQRMSDMGTLGEIPKMVFAGRYLLLMMGAFATYCGLIYNDCFSVPFNLFGSTYGFDSDNTHSYTLISDSHDRHPHHRHTDSGDGERVGYKVHDAGVYPFGIDPAWYHTTNSLAFFNSFKMKLSVTLGVIQMTFGLVLSLLNHMYENDYTNVVFEFIPRLLFLMCTFGYMIFICIYKMCIDWSHSHIQPPALVQTMIAMFLSPGTVDKHNQLYAGQATVQTILLLVALGSIPVMLLATPFITNRKHKQLYPADKDDTTTDSSTEQSSSTKQLNGNGYHSLLSDDVDNGSDNGSDIEEQKDNGSNGLQHRNKSYQSITSDDSSSTKECHKPHSLLPHTEEQAADESGGGHSEFDPASKHYSFSDHLITNSIHTIEYVLGAVSNTASYLRLWALSLAHAELSDVFWSRMIMQYGINTGSYVMTAIGFAVWATATFAVLLCMDVLECFLHALRLHWVEFQNKFYHADGIPYTPFDTSFKGISQAE